MVSSFGIPMQWLKCEVDRLFKCVMIFRHKDRTVDVVKLSGFVVHKFMCSAYTGILICGYNF